MDRFLKKKNYSNIKFHENPSSVSRVSCEQTDGRTDMTKLRVAFHNFANTPKKYCAFRLYNAFIYIYIFCLIIQTSSDYLPTQI